MGIESLARAAVDSGLAIHRDLGPGLLESVYERVLAKTLERRGIRVECQKAISFRYAGIIFEEGFRADLLLNGRLLIELKAAEKLVPVHSKQLLTYLRLMNLPLGLLMNFGGATFREGVHRILNAQADLSEIGLRETR